MMIMLATNQNGIYIPAPVLNAFEQSMYSTLAELARPINMPKAPGYIDNIRKILGEKPD